MGTPNPLGSITGGQPPRVIGEPPHPASGVTVGAATPALGWDTMHFGVPTLTPSLSAPRPEGRPYGALPPQRQEEVERLLETGGPGGDWRSLAARLGYGDEAIGTFARGQAPARTLLAAWAATEGATLEALCLALAAVGRQDVAERLAGPGDASSVV